MNRPADRNHTLILKNTSAKCERSKLELHSIGFVERPDMSRRSRRCPEDVQKVSRRCPEGVHRRLEKNVGTSRESSAGVLKASGVLPKVSLSQVKP